MAALETAATAAGWIGVLLTWLRGRGQAKRVAKLAEVLAHARTAAKLVAGLAQAAAIEMGAVLSTWEQKFGELVRLAGLEVTPAQELEALTEARAELRQLGVYAMGVQGARLSTAAARFDKRIDQLIEQLAKGKKR